VITFFFFFVGLWSQSADKLTIHSIPCSWREIILLPNFIEQKVFFFKYNRKEKSLKVLWDFEQEDE
jgi:hypothetical protein